MSRKLEESSSKGKTIGSNVEGGDTTTNEIKSEGSNIPNDHSKFKKVEMPIFSGHYPDSWLFQVDRYFQIHKLTDTEKMIVVAVISFDGTALDWCQSQEEQDPFKDWQDLKQRLMIRFRSVSEGSIYRKFLAIRQEITVEEYRNLFDKLVVSLPQLPKEVLEETFMNGPSPWIKAEVEC